MSTVLEFRPSVWPSSAEHSPSCPQVHRGAAPCPRCEPGRYALEGAKHRSDR